MGVRYIGSKARIADPIVALAGDPEQGGRFVDAFCGSGAVATAAAGAGWRVLVNDSLPSAVTMTTSALVTREMVPFEALGGYENAISELNAVPSAEGFIYREYSPASALSGGVERRYFTEENARRIDAARVQIAAWFRKGKLTRVEEQLLLGDLLVAVNEVANIAGTYGCFLSGWTAQAKRPFSLKTRRLAPLLLGLESRVGDVFDVPTTPDDVVYFDPPYTKRQYAAYYHLLETIVLGDEPEVGGVTGLRPWRDKASDFCYKRKALDALTRLVRDTRARSILLSYSNEAHVARDELVSSLRRIGGITIHDVESIGRYRPNVVASETASTVHEYVIEVRPYASAAVNVAAEEVG